MYAEGVSLAAAMVGSKGGGGPGGAAAAGALQPSQPTAVTAKGLLGSGATGHGDATAVEQCGPLAAGERVSPGPVRGGGGPWPKFASSKVVPLYEHVGIASSGGKGLAAVAGAAGAGGVPLAYGRAKTLSQGKAGDGAGGGGGGGKMGVGARSARFAPSASVKVRVAPGAVEEGDDDSEGEEEVGEDGTALHKV